MMSEYEWVVYILSNSGDGKVTDFLHLSEEEMDGLELDPSFFAKDMIFRIEKQLKEQS